MQLPPWYREPRSPRYWKTYVAINGLVALGLVTAGLLNDRTFTILLAVPAVIGCVLCLLALRQHHRHQQ